MTVYSFYIFDRHTECIYQRRWTPPPPPTSTTKRPISTASSSALSPTHTLPANVSTVSSPPNSASSSRPQSRSQQSRPQSSSTSTPSQAPTTTTNNPKPSPDQTIQYPTSTVTPKAANDAKLLFGVIFSLRNLTRQLGGSLTPSSSSNPARDTASSSSTLTDSTTTTTVNTDPQPLHHPNTTADEFLSYTTAEYKLHYYETATNLKFCMLTDPKTANLRVVLHQIWANLWVEYVVRNPLSPVDFGTRAPTARTGTGATRPMGVGNELFEMGLDRFVAQVVNPV